MKTCNFRPIALICIFLAITFISCSHKQKQGIENTNRAKVEIREALESRDFDTLKSLAKKNRSNLEVDVGDGLTPLQYAISNGDEELAGLLIDIGAHVNTRDPEGKTPFHKAVSLKDSSKALAICKRLAKKMADINSLDNQQNSPLNQLVSEEADLEVVEFILQQGADASLKNSEGISPLEKAEQLKLTEIIQLIDKYKGENVKTDAGLDKIHQVCYNGDIKTLKELAVKSPESINHKDKGGNTPLHKAVTGIQKEIVEYLLDQGADVNALNNQKLSALHYSAYDKNTEIGKLLISKGADVKTADEKGETPLHKAVKLGNLELTKLIVEHGGDVNIGSNNRVTPLHEAANWGHDEIAVYLINQGADINAVDADGKNPLKYAIEKKHMNVSKILLEKGDQE